MDLDHKKDCKTFDQIGQWVTLHCTKIRKAPEFLISGAKLNCF